MKIIFTILCFALLNTAYSQESNLENQKIEVTLDVAKPLFHGFGASVEYFYNNRVGFEMGYNYIKINRIKSRFSFLSDSRTDQEMNYDKQSLFINYKVYSKRVIKNDGKFGGIYMKFKSSQNDEIIIGNKAYWNDFILGVNRGYKKVFNNKLSFAMTIGVGIVIYSSSNSTEPTIDNILSPIPVELVGLAQIGYRF